MRVTLALHAACFPRFTPLKIVGCCRVQQDPALTSLLVQQFERCGIHSQRSHCSLLNEEGIATTNSTSQLKRHITTRSHLQNISKAAERTGRVECNCHQQHSSLPLTVTVVPLIPNHVTCIALVISLIVQRSLGCIRVAFWAVVARELLPRSFPVIARF